MNQDSFGPYKGPALVVVAGPMGAGKTTDQWLMFPDAWALALPGSDKPVVQFMGHSIPVEHVLEVRTFMDCSNVMGQIAQLPVEKRPRALICDDISIIADNTHNDLRPQYPASHNFQFWGRIKMELGILRDWLRHLRIWALVSSHLDGPSNDMDGNFYAGGPAMPSLKMRKILVHIADDVYCVEMEPGREPWPYYYRCEPDPQWAMKSRHGFRGKLPLNLREMMLSAGYVIHRPAGMEWMDVAAGQIAKAIIDGQDKADVWNRAEDQLTGRGIPEGLVYWTLRDGVDRAALAKRGRLLGRFRS